MLDFVDGAVDEAEELRTGMWHALEGTTLEGLGGRQADELPAGVSVRRVGNEVQVQKVDPNVSIVVDGVEVEDASISLETQVLTVGGIPVTEDMVPRDILELDQLPDFFEPVTIGRSDHCDFHVASGKVSSQHAVLSRQEGHVLLEDQDSFNGTFVEGRRIKRARIGWRQEFRVADHKLTALQVMQQVVAEKAASKTSLINVMPMMDEVYRINNPGGLPSHSQPRLDVARTEAGAAAPLSPFEEDTQPRGVPAGGGDTQGMRMGGLISASRRLTVGQSLVVGRAPTADVVLMTPNVSHFHARITRREEGMVVEDLGSTNGTWINGARVIGVMPLQPTDDLRLGPHRLEINEDLSINRQDLEGGARGVRLDAYDLVRQVGPASNPITVVDRVSFTILPGEMVAVMGPSGAGKTSVLTTLAGYTPPSSGDVFMDGYSLYQHYDVFRSAVGYVPQEDVMHRTLSVEEVLYYHARLEFPAEVSDAEIHERIATVLGQLDLSHVAGTVVGDENIRGLSGGQRKRLNVAMELMSEPSLLILDEPTSGLDARSAMELIRQCRDLATAGRTVAMTIHQPRLEAFQLFDKVLLLTTGGKVAYFGPPGAADADGGGEEGVRAYFSQHSALSPLVAQNPADYALDALDPVDVRLKRDPDYWDEAYRASPGFQKFMKERGKSIEQEKTAQKKLGGLRKQRKAGFFRQLHTLTMRYAKIKWRDRTSLLVQLAQAPVIAGLALLLFHEGRFMPLFLEDDITPTIFVLMAAAVWFGCSNVAREVVGERAIYRRERMGRLRPGAYLLSKVLLQGLLIGVQVGILLAVLVPGVPLQGGIVPLAGAALLAGWSAMALGLLLSTVARTELQAIQFVPLAILPQIMLSGILIPVAGSKATVMATWLSKPILLRWAYASGLWVEFSDGVARGVKAASSAGAQYWQRSGFKGDELGTDLAVVAGLGLVCLAVSFAVLSRRDNV
jgi:ABC-type multidrug transport system ATPase subunit/pSer/pThr/pTyr-binding forkhead associated (FHA) protein